MFGTIFRMNSREGIRLRRRRNGWFWLGGLGVLALVGLLWLNTAKNCLDEDWASGLSVSEEGSSGAAQIAFIRPYGGEYGVLVADANSADQQELFKGATTPHLAWSPDGAHIAFTSRAQYSRAGRVMVMDRDGANQRLLTGDEFGVASAPAWSPDGSQLAFGGFRTDSTGVGVVVMDRDGTDVRQIVEGMDVVDDLMWSPDGRRIAFAGWIRNLQDSKGTGNGVGRIVNVRLAAVASFLPLDLYVVDADGADLRELGGGRSPVWSPDGNKILFEAIGGSALGAVELESGGIQMFTRHLPGFTRRSCSSDDCSVSTLDPTEVRFGGARWSPGGEYILFSADRDGDYELFLMDAATERVCQLTDNAFQDWDPVWSPDGGRIAFSSDRDGDFQIYVMNADGTAVTQITDDEQSAWWPVWSPGNG